jgi:alpha-tubulin suppressor-like RCC1 family protein
MNKILIYLLILSSLISCNPPEGANSLTDIPGTSPSAPSGIVRLNPQMSIGLDSTPEFTVSGVVSGDTIKLFTDSSCSSEVASVVAAASSVNITTASPLIIGSYSFYGNATNASGTSPCSTVSASYSYGSRLNQRLSVGTFNTFALTPEGGIKSWGLNKWNANFNGMLGDGTLLTRYSPVDHETLTSDVRSVSAGTFNFLALTSLNEVKFWNEWIRLTDLLTLGSEVVAISTNSTHSCALNSLGGVQCWGYNDYGELGDGTTNTPETSITPVQVVASLSGDLLSNIVAISTGNQHTCALTSLGTVKCWGRNSSGQLGDGTTTNSLLPVDVKSNLSGDFLSNIVAISAGGSITCALTSLGTVKCWGNNSSGQLGDGTTTNSLLPVDVKSNLTGDLLSNIVALSGKSDTSCALTSLGGVKCWGFNFYGNLGNKTRTNSSLPVDVFGLNSGVEEISLHQLHSCALTSLGGVKCWGLSSDGRLGDGTEDGGFQTEPVDVINFP